MNQAMQNGITADEAYLLRFHGIARLYGEPALQRFRQARVAVIGIGGVGSWAAEALARSGIGRLRLIDGDAVAPSNINRQIHALESTIGSAKTAALQARIREINPQCACEALECFLSEENLAELITPDLDYVVDCIDSVIPKTALAAYCNRNKIRLILLGGAGGRSDPTQIQVTDLNRTQHDALAAKVRSRLRWRYGFSRNPKRRYGIACVYSTEQPKYPTPEGGICQAKPDAQGRARLDCATGYGAATPVTASFAFVAVSRVLARLAKQST